MKRLGLIGLACAAMLAGCERNNAGNTAAEQEQQQLNQDRSGIIAPGSEGTGGAGQQTPNTFGELPAGGAPQRDGGQQ